VLIDDLQLRQSAEVTIGLPFLGFHYISAICVGYLIGYFLLLSVKPTERAWRRISPLDRLTSLLFGATAWTLALLIPASLLYRNGSLIRANDGRVLRDFAELILANISEPEAVAVADDPLLLNLVHIRDRQTRGGDDRLMLYTPFLQYALYQRSLHRLHPHRWQDLPADIPDSAILDSRMLVIQISSLTTTNPTYYLHPSFGYFFEQVYLTPRGLTYPLATYDNNAVAPPALAPETRQRNDAFWNNVLPKLQSLIPLVARRVPDARAVGRWYSRALDYWAVELQQLNQLQDAARLFTLATQLNPDNLVAKINLEYNQSLQRNNPARVDLAKSAEDQFGPKYRTWDAFLSANGPVDEPGFRLRLAQLLEQQGNLRQAILHLQRVAQLEPDNRPALLDLAEVYLRSGLPSQSLESISQLRSLRPGPEEQIQAARLEAEAQAALGDAAAAESTLLNALKTHPNAEQLLDTLAELYKITDQPEKALEISDRHLALNPRATHALIRKAVLYMKQEDYTRAEDVLTTLAKVAPNSVPALLTQSAFYVQTQRYNEALQVTGRLLELDPQNQWALINRAIALLQSNQLDEAKAVYLQLHKRMPREHRFHFGLGEIAYRQNNHADAAKYFELYLKNAPPDTEEARQIAQRLQQLQSQSNSSP
jgi:tetratricopeptide (TPR) repeat protein